MKTNRELSTQETTKTDGVIDQNKRLIDTLIFIPTEFDPVNVRDVGENDPTPSEIEKACREIQDGWTPTQKRIRRTGRVAYELVEVSTKLPGRKDVIQKD